MILDDGGDATGLLILGGLKRFIYFNNPANEEIALFNSIKSKLLVDSSFYSNKE